MDQDFGHLVGPNHGFQCDYGVNHVQHSYTIKHQAIKPGGRNNTGAILKYRL
jgi:hypothetical protein